MYLILKSLMAYKRLVVFAVLGLLLSGLGSPIQAQSLGKADIDRSLALILDLRGNADGYELTLLRLLGQFFDHDVKIGDIKGTEPLIAKSSGKNPFKGKLIVLVDSKTGSAAEMLARVVQIEKRGIVVGDRSAGR